VDLAERSHWLVVTSPENFEATRRVDFTLQGFKARHDSRTARIREGDRLLWYLTRLQVFAGTATVLSPRFEDRERIWEAPGKPAEDYPWRVRIRPDRILGEAGLRAAEFRDRLDYVAKWPAEHWRLAFQGMLHLWPHQDFETVERALRRTARR
jgi:hypothetical protein